MNTKIEYLYRDNSNYKKWNECVIRGTVTDEQVKTIVDCLEDGEYFIPSLVGLPEEKFGSTTVDDTPWFELGFFDFSPTEKKPTVDMDGNELVRRFKNQKGKWLNNCEADAVVQLDAVLSVIRRMGEEDTSLKHFAEEAEKRLKEEMLA